MISRAFDRWVFSAYEPATRGLAVYRILFALYLLVLEIPRHRWITHFPDSFFSPPIGLTMFFTGFPGPVFFHLLNFALVLAALALLVGYRTHWASIAVALLLLVSNAWAYSFGKINHDILLVLVPLIMAGSSWGDRLSVGEPRAAPAASTRPAWPLALLALVIGLAMFTAALPKILSGWLDPSVQATRGHLLKNVFFRERETYLSTLLLDFDASVFWILLDYGAVLLEAGFILAVLSHTSMRVFCAFACIFHVGVFLMMDIMFTSNVVAYAAFASWTLVLRPEPVRDLLLRLDRRMPRLNGVRLMGGAVLIFAIQYLLEEPLLLARPFGRATLLFVGAAVGAAFLLNAIRGLLPLRHREWLAGARVALHLRR